eukprot:m.14384 g.14384  ORF g.14384 m.14384 type:complete len:332 (-) comp10268_c0_seq1:50-1045(-)
MSQIVVALRRSGRAAISTARVVKGRMTMSMSREEAAEVDARLSAAQTDYSVSNLDLNKVRFESTEAKEGVFQPQLFYGDEPKLQLVTPFAMAGFCRMSKLGNFGVEKRFPSGTVTVDELDKAEYEVMLTTQPLVDQLGPEGDNAKMAEFLDFVQGVRAKLVEHVGDNLEAYEQISKKNPFLLKSGEEIRSEFLTNCTTSLERSFKDLNDAQWRCLSMKERVYLKLKPGSTITAKCEEDEGMKEQGFTRRTLPVYDAEGNIIPLEEQQVMFGDVVAVALELYPFVYNVAGNAGIKLGSRLKSVTVGRKRFAAKASGGDGDSLLSRSPFGSIA